jgi:hypothetical protein
MGTAMKMLRSVLVLAPVLVGMIVFFRVVRPWYLRWGATDEDLGRAMPLDDHVPRPRLNSTMAITVNAPPEHIWPWLTQIGEAPRAGYYSYEWIERVLGLDVENSRQVMPQYQHLEVGDALDHVGSMTVLAVEPNHHLVLGPPTAEPVGASWAFGLYPIDDHSTRLVTRVHGHWSWLGMLRDNPPYTWPFYLLLEPGAFVMERKMLLEIKARAEGMSSG